DAGMGGQPFFSMAYAFSGLLSGLFSRHGRLLFTISFILAHTIAVLWTWGMSVHTAAVYEVFIVSTLFVALPSGLIGKFAIDLGGEVTSDSAASRAKEDAEGRIKQLATAFHSLYETVKTPPTQWKNDNDISTVFDRAAEYCCRQCKEALYCWQIDYETTLDVMNNATPPMLTRGELQETDLPQHFRDNCQHLDRYIDLVNFELRALLQRQQHGARLHESQTALAAQYADMGRILSGLAGELHQGLTPEPIRERKLRRYLKTQDIDAETTVYRARDGRLHAEVKGEDIRILLRDSDRLAKLSAVLGVRLCERRTDVPLHYRKRLTVMEAEPLAAAVGIASVRRKGQSVSGDRSTYFKTEDGTLYVILCDGMGTGKDAARESGQLSDILEQFLQAGLDPSAAMKLANGAFQVKNGAITGCASVDLFSLNLFTGEARLFKYGAAPSYVKRGPNIRAIRGESLAAGLTPRDPRGAHAPDTETLRIEPGAFTILLSDGISQDSADDNWLQSLLADYTGAEPKDLARAILEAAIARTGYEDDKTVLVIYVEERG
ncbi:MAG: SpoIIE family protein phosphatase, partial [Oscillospiraceae bacterium]|nr:SpoIIE family protein phosphatase [Oscillospiraceae bacterium]